VTKTNHQWAVGDPVVVAHVTEQGPLFRLHSTIAAQDKKTILLACGKLRFRPDGTSLNTGISEFEAATLLPLAGDVAAAYRRQHLRAQLVAWAEQADEAALIAVLHAAGSPEHAPCALCDDQYWHTWEARTS
jgi:hypothetical protein